MQIKVNTAFGLNIAGSIAIYKVGIHDVSKEVATHPYTLLNATVLEDVKPTLTKK